MPVPPVCCPPTEKIQLPVRVRSRIQVATAVTASHQKTEAYTRPPPMSAADPKTFLAES